MSRSVGCSRFIFDRSIDRTQSLFSLNGAGSIKIDRMIGHSFCPVLNINCTGSGKADFGDFNNGVCDVMKIAIAESNTDVGL